MKKSDMPVGFGMALAMNPEAMGNFAVLSEAEKQQIIDGTHSVTSKSEMRRYVDNIKSMDSAHKKPVSTVYPVIDNDLARDNVENDITAADLQDL